MKVVKIRKRFFNCNFLGGHFFTKTNVLFGISITFYIFDTLYPISRKKNFTLQKGCFSHFSTQKPKKGRNATK
jgi:hypothetical protein